jgi:hypothetical protein
MTNIWTVNGSTGEYSDHRKWIVCAYCSEKEAAEHAANAQARANLLQAEYDYYSIPTGTNEFDPQMRMRSDYTGTDYYVSMIELRDAPKEFQAWVKLRS